MSAERPPKPAPAWDAPLTVALLVAGVFNVTVLVADARQMPEALEETYRTQGIGTYTNVPLASAMGWAVIVASVLALVLAIGIAVPRMRAHRIAFWVPVVAAATSIALTIAFIAIAWLGDPALVPYLERAGGR